MKPDVGVLAVRGVAWLGSGQLVRQLFAFVTNIVLARLLFPDDFGLFGMAFAATEVAQMLTDFGLGAALIQRRETNPITLTTCFWLNLLIGAAIALALLAASPFIAGYFGRQEIRSLFLPLALNMLLGASLVVPYSVLIQDLRFRDITMAQTAGSIAASIGSIGLAVAGFGVFALVMQPILGNLITGTGYFALAKWLPRGKPKLSSVRGILRFSSHLLGNNLVNCIGRNLQAAILGRQLGSAALGYYGLASGMTGTILFQVSSVIIRVLFPTLSNLKDEPERLHQAWFKACAAIAAIAFPAMAGIIAVAPDLVPVVFGPQWTPAINVLRILSVTMAIQSVLTTSGTVLMSLGRADLLFRISIASIFCTATGLLIGVTFGIEGAAIGYGIAGTATYLATTWLACRRANAKIAMLARALLPWFSCSIGMCVGVIILERALEQLPAQLRLALSIMAGVILYGALLLVFARQQALTLFRDVQSRLSPAKKQA